MKRFGVLVLVSAFIVGNCLITRAETVGNAIGEVNTGTVAVKASVPEEWSFVIPAEVVLQVTDETRDENGYKAYKAEFDVSVKGDIAVNHQIKMSMDALTLTVVGGDENVAADYVIPKTIWSREDCYANDFLGTTSTYGIVARLAPGSYRGIANYTIGLEDVE